MFKPTLWNLWDYIVDEGCLRTDCGTEEYLIKWNWQHRVPVKLEDISWWATKYGITLPSQWADKEVTLIEDLPFDEKSIFMLSYSNWPLLQQPFETNDKTLYFEYVDEDTWNMIQYAFPILWYNTDYELYYSSLNYPDDNIDWDNFKDGEIKMIIDFFWKPVLLTYLKTYYDEENHQQEREYFLDSQWNPLKPKFSNFSFDDTTEKWFESLHFEMDWIKFNMNPHFPYLPDWFKFDDENMEHKDWIDYDVVLKTAQKYVQNILSFDDRVTTANLYSLFYKRYKAWPWLDRTARWLQWNDIYWWKITKTYDDFLNEKFIIDMGNPQSFVDETAWIMPNTSEEIDWHTYNTATFVVWDKNESEFIKWLMVTINDESSYESQPTKEWDAELTLIDNVLSSLTNEQKYSLFEFFEKIISSSTDLIMPKEYFESEETFRRFIVSLLSGDWDQIDYN